MPVLTVLIGPPGCGKSTWARSQDGTHLATDDVRDAMIGDVEDHSRDDEVARRFDELVHAAVDGATDVLVENGANARRLDYLGWARAAGQSTRAVVFENWDQAREWAMRRAEPELLPQEWETLAHEAREAAVAVDDEGWDEVVRRS